MGFWVGLDVGEGVVRLTVGAIVGRSVGASGAVVGRMVGDDEVMVGDVVGVVGVSVGDTVGALMARSVSNTFPMALLLVSEMYRAL